MQALDGNQIVTVSNLQESFAVNIDEACSILMDILASRTDSKGIFLSLKEDAQSYELKASMEKEGDLFGIMRKDSDFECENNFRELDLNPDHLAQILENTDHVEKEATLASAKKIASQKSILSFFSKK